MVERVNLILQTKNLSASEFAAEIGVQRSNVSHVLSGRNRPSLDFIQKVLNRYPDINADWLLLGKGSMYEKTSSFTNVNKNEEAKETRPKPPDLFSSQESWENTAAKASESAGKPTETAPEPGEKSKVQGEARVKEEDREEYKHWDRTEKPGIEKIVIFYRDRTFKEYFPEK